MSIAAAALILLAGNSSASLIVQVPRPESVDVAYSELSSGQNDAALVRLLAARERRENDPAVLINLGAAYARLGQPANAIEAFEAAMVSRQRYDLETGDGTWRDSRDIARQSRAEILSASQSLAVR